MVKVRKIKRQAWDSCPVMSKEQTAVCSCAECGEAFSEPLELNVRAEDSIETYPACPHCFSRLTDSDFLKKRPGKAVLRASAKADKEPVKDTEEEKPLGCIHSLGYLKARPKGSPIPDECLTCTSVMQCMGFSGL